MYSRSPWYILTLLGVFFFVLGKTSAGTYWYQVPGELVCKGRPIVRDQDADGSKPGAVVALWYSDDMAIHSKMSTCVSKPVFGGCEQRISRPVETTVKNDMDNANIGGLYNRFRLQGVDDHEIATHFKPYLKVTGAQCGDGGVRTVWFKIPRDRCHKKADFHYTWFGLRSS